MNLYTIKEVKRPTSADDVHDWHDGCAWLAGGTWLFSEPQIKTNTLIDLEDLGWTSLEASAGGLDIAATCKIRELYDFKPPKDWIAAPLIHDCCLAFLASFKIWNAATVGGNIVMSLPAGPMTSLTTALEGVVTLWPRNGKPREVKMIDFVTGNNKNVLAAGRTAAQHSSAGRRVEETLRLPPLVAHPSRALGGAADRHQVAGERLVLADRHGLDDPPAAARLREDADRGRTAAGGRHDDSARPLP